MEKTLVKIKTKRFKRNQNDKVKNNTISSQTPRSFMNTMNTHNKIIDYNEPNSLDWSNSESIYNYLISYINLMIIDLSKDKEKLCKYLKDIFYAIFKISQEIKNNNQNIEDKNEENNNEIKKEDWNFLTGEQFIRKNNSNLMEQLLKEETKNLEPLLTQRTERKNIFQISPFKIKIDRLQRKFKQKEKQFNADKLSYLFRINEQNNLIKKLEKEIKDNNINYMTPKELNKIKCFPDYSFIKENYMKLKKGIINNNIKKLEDNKENDGSILNNIKYLNIINNNKNNNNKLNLKKVFSKNLSLLKTGGKLEKMRIMRFASFSLSDTKINVEKIKNYKL